LWSLNKEEVELQLSCTVHESQYLQARGVPVRQGGSHTRTHIHTLAHAHTHAHTSTHLHMQTYMNIHTHTYTHTYTHTNTHMQTQTHTNAHTHTYTHKNTQTHLCGRSPAHQHPTRWLTHLRAPCQPRCLRLRGRRHFA